MSATNKYQQWAPWPSKKPTPPEITAQPSRRGRQHRDTISIQSLASFPELLPRRWEATPTKSLRPTHKTACECDKCEASESDISELNFDD
jgi:hypothetical protein